jgi:hypothetical protein
MSMTTITILPGAEAAIENAAIDAEMIRLLIPDARRPDVALDIQASHVDRTLVGRRIGEEATAIGAWVLANLSRERRRELGHLSTLTLDIHTRKFWDTEPDLDFNTWGEQLRACAMRLVRRRALVGAPTFAVWQHPVAATTSAPKWPSVLIVNPSPQRLTGALRSGLRDLEGIISDEEAYLDGLRRLREIVTAMRNGRKPTEAERAEAFKALIPVLEIARDHDDVTPEGRVTETLGLHFGLRVLGTGGANCEPSETRPAQYDDSEPYAWTRDTIEYQIAQYGLRDGSPPVPPVPAGCESLTLP